MTAKITSIQLPFFFLFGFITPLISIGQNELILADTLVLCGQDSAVLQLDDPSYNMVVWEDVSTEGRVINDQFIAGHSGVYNVFAADSSQGDTTVCFATTDTQMTTYLDLPEGYMITDVIVGYYGTPVVDCQNPQPGSCHIDVTEVIRNGLVGKRSSNYFQGAHPDLCTGVVKTLFVKLRCMKYVEDSVVVQQLSAPLDHQLLSDTSVCAENVVALSLPSLTCDTTYVPLDTLVLSITSNNDVSSIPTKAGVPYKLTVNNAVSYGGGSGNQADGAFSNITANPIESITWRLDGMQFGTLPDFRPVPNEYNPDHVYEFFILGSGQPVVFRANDCCLGDNSGQYQFILSEMQIDRRCELDYAWSNGESGPVVTLSPSPNPVTLYLTNGTAHCPIDTVTVAPIESSLTIDAGSFVAVCPGDSVTLSASGSAETYTWSHGFLNGETFSPDSSSWFLVEGTGGTCLEFDSVFVDVLATSQAIDSRAACDSLTWIDGITYTESTNEPTVILENVAGCDSIVTLNLTVNYATYSEIDTTVYESFEYNGVVYTETGEYVIDFENALGCDSTVTLNLEFGVDGIGVNGHQRSWSVFPNPTSGPLTIAFDENTSEQSVSIFNHLGQQVWAHSFVGRHTLDVSNWPRGLYFIHHAHGETKDQLTVVLE